MSKIERKTMSENLFRVIEGIAERNGAIRYYPLEKFENGGVTWLTCSSWLFPETSSEWLFSDISEKEALTLLQAFVSADTCCTMEVLRHFARLMATMGGLVARQMDELLEKTDWGSYASQHQLLAYLAVKPNGCNWIVRLLDIVPNDARDGLFVACWYCNDHLVQNKLLKKFEDWSKDPTWGSGDREGAWLEQFLGKWIAEGMFSCGQLEQLVVWHFKHRHALR